MSSNASKTAVVFGSGPGIGISVASSFAVHGFNHIVLLSRNAERLQSDKNTILGQTGGTSVKIDTIQVDISDQSALKKALTKIDDLGGNIECIFFNAAKVAPSPLLEFPVEELELDFKVMCSPRQ
jgi:short-subunit dehydrogenase